MKKKLIIFILKMKKDIKVQILYNKNLLMMKINMK